MKALEKIILKIRIFIVAVLLTFILIPALLVFLVPCTVFHRISRIIASIIRKDLEESFTEAGVLFAHDPYHVRPKTTVLSFIICDGPLCLQELQSNFHSRVLSYQDDQGKFPYTHLKQYWVQFMGYLYWKKDKNFEIKNHVRIYDYCSADCSLPNICSENDLRRVGGFLVTEPFHQDQSPWEILLIQNYKLEKGDETKIGTVLAFRIHHALADGYSIYEMLYRWFDYKTSSKPAIFPKTTLFVGGLRLIQALLMFPWNLATLFESIKDNPSAWNPIGTKMSRNYNLFVSKPISVDTFKAIAKVFGVTYNAACYSVTVGAIVRMMKAAGHEVPRKVTSTFPLPLPHHPGGLTNHAGQWFFNFNPHDMNSSQRLRHISKAAKPARIFQTRTLVGPWLMKLQKYLVVPLRKAALPSFNNHFAVSNVPGTTTSVPISVDTSWVDGFAMIGSVRNSSLGAVSLMASFHGKQRISLAVDRAIQFTCPMESLDFDGFVQEEIADLLLISKDEAV